MLEGRGFTLVRFNYKVKTVTVRDALNNEKDLTLELVMSWMPRPDSSTSTTQQ